jgi:hypothetical protein
MRHNKLINRNEIFPVGEMTTSLTGRISFWSVRYNNLTDWKEIPLVNEVVIPH